MDTNRFGVAESIEKICGGEMIKCEGKKKSRHNDILKKTRQEVGLWHMR